MVQRKKPENVAGQQICVTKRTKQRILDLREGGEFHENVIVRLLDFWDANRGDGEKSAERKVTNL